MGAGVGRRTEKSGGCGPRHWVLEEGSYRLRPDLAGLIDDARDRVMLAAEVPVERIKSTARRPRSSFDWPNVRAPTSLSSAAEGTGRRPACSGRRAKPSSATPVCRSSSCRAPTRLDDGASGWPTCSGLRRSPAHAESVRADPTHHNSPVLGATRLGLCGGSRAANRRSGWDNEWPPIRRGTRGRQQPGFGPGAVGRLRRRRSERRLARFGFGSEATAQAAPPCRRNRHRRGRVVTGEVVRRDFRSSR